MGKLPDLVQNVPKTEVSFPCAELIDHLLAEEIFLYCLNCFRTTGDENMLHFPVVYSDVYRNQAQSSDKDLILTLTEESCMKVSKQYP